MKRRNHIGIVFFLALELFISVSAGAQVGSAFEPEWPQNRQDVAGKKLGGVSVSIPGNAANVMGNPANLASIDHRTIFFSLANTQNNFVFKDLYAKNETTLDWHQGLKPGYCAISWPFRSFGKKWVIAASYNGVHWPEFDERYVSDNSNLFNFSFGKKGHSRSLSLGIATKPISKISVGMGLTNWFGKTNWRYEGFGNGSCNFSSQGLHAGVNGQFGRLSVGSVFYFPHQLMTCTSNSTGWGTNYSLSLSKDFNGAVEVGVGYSLSTRLTIALGYGYQRGFDFITKTRDWQATDKQSKSAKLSGGFQYESRFRHAVFPIYFGYRIVWPPKKKINLPPGYISISNSDKESFRKELLFGASYKYKSTEFYFDTKWTASSFHISERALPPWS